MGGGGGGVKLGVDGGGVKWFKWSKNSLCDLTNIALGSLG